MRKILILVALAALLVPASIARGSEGRIDTDFGSEGELTLPQIDYSTPEVVLLDDGRIVLFDGVRLSVLLSTGKPDPSVRGTGEIQVSAPAAGNCGIGAVAQDDLGRFVGVGRCHFPDEPERDAYPQNHPGKLFVERWTPRGDLDLSFGGGDGMVVSDLGLPPPAEGLLPALVAYDVAFDSLGRIVIAGWRESGYEPAYKSLGYQLSSESFAVRLTEEGEVDRSFGGSGVIEVPGLGGIGGMVADARGGLLLAYFNYDTTLMRIAADGGIDSGYGENGFRKLARGRGLRRYQFGLLGSDREGRAIFSARVSGLKDRHVKNGVAFKRLTSDGSLDRSFGRQGVLTSRFRRMLYSVEAIDDRGRMLVAMVIRPRNPGSIRTTETLGISLARLRPDGGLDRSFGRRGILEIVFNPGGQDYLDDIQVAGDVAVIEEDRCEPRKSCRTVLIRAELDS